MDFTVNINVIPRSVDVDADTPLLWVLRDVLGTTGTKFVQRGSLAAMRHGRLNIQTSLEAPGSFRR
jgi:aerobic-type carbon monoxide dehydrogenase small subunit (CoxS/CutS family)